MEKYGSAYQIKKAVSRGEIFQIEKGVYSDQKRVSTLEIIIKKYPKAIITMNSAFYYYGLTDVIPDNYYLATPSNAWKISDRRVKQIYVPEKIFRIGVENMERQGIHFSIYSRERMLIELVRNKNSLPYDYYKEIIGSYRNHIHELQIETIQDYIELFPKSSKIDETLATEVF